MIKTKKLVKALKGVLLTVNNNASATPDQYFKNSQQANWHKSSYNIDLDDIEKNDPERYRQLLEAALKFAKSNAYDQIGRTVQKNNWVNTYRTRDAQSSPLSKQEMQNLMLVMWRPMVSSYNNKNGFGLQFLNSRDLFVGNGVGEFTGDSRDSYKINDTFSDYMDNFWTSDNGNGLLLSVEDFKQIKPFWDLTRATRLRSEDVQGNNDFKDAYGERMASNSWNPNWKMYTISDAPEIPETYGGFEITGDEGNLYRTLREAAKTHKPYKIQYTDEFGKNIDSYVYSDKDGNYYRVPRYLGHDNRRTTISDWNNRVRVSDVILKKLNEYNSKNTPLRKFGGKLKKITL